MRDRPPGPVWQMPGSGSSWSALRPDNAVTAPPGASLAPQGGRWVVVRLVLGSREELLAGRAIRWTREHVMVRVPDPYGPENGREMCAWVPARDVYRTVPRRKP